MIPVAPAAHYLCGGIKVNLDGESSIRRLYAIGECSCTGLHAESLIGGYDLRDDVPDWNDEGTEHPDEMVLITQSEREVNAIMGTYVGIVRSDLRLKRAWNRLDILYRETEDLFRRSKPTRQLCELRNIINVAYLVMRQALERKESRGLHYTVDYPHPPVAGA